MRCGPGSPKQLRSAMIKDPVMVNVAVVAQTEWLIELNG